jgi:hypothetical protein
MKHKKWWGAEGRQGEV